MMENHEENENKEHSIETTSIESKHEKSPDEILKRRKEAVIRSLKENNNWFVYALLAIVVTISVKIRSSNVPGLRDITTGGWSLGPDLDPYLFLRWAEYIVEHGKLFAVDSMRYVPIGYETNRELILHPYLIAWFHNVYSFLGFGSGSVIESAARYPVFIFALTVIVFFFMTRKIFAESLGVNRANIIALISSFFLSVLPPLLPRTIAGIPEKESSGFLLLFLSFYLFLIAWNDKNLKKQIFFALLSSITTIGMMLVWGGHLFLFSTIALSVLLAFIFGQVNKNKRYVYALWIIPTFIIPGFFVQKFAIGNLLTSVTRTVPLLVLLIIFVDKSIFNTRIKKLKRLFDFKRVSGARRIYAIVGTLALSLAIVAFFFGPNIIISNLTDIAEYLVTPISTRLGVTVAENRQPFFNEWANNFGPQVKNIPLFFWLFLMGAVYLFNKSLMKFKPKEKFVLTIAYVIFLISVVFSRYSPNTVLNGTSTQSIVFYGLGFLILISTMGFYYYKRNKENEMSIFKSISFGSIFLLSLFFIGIVSARGAVRVIMVLVPPASIIVSYFVVSIIDDAKKSKNEIWKVISWLFVGIIVFSIIFSGISFYKVSSNQAKAFFPSAYNQQWQKAMSWVRDNTPENAVFGHWWDYGYWIQSIGKRATILDGGNSVSYWNHFMGRYALTGRNNTDALEFLYAHNTTHFLIDSTDIGKYGAFSSIGSDVDYDRRSNIPSLFKDFRLTQERKNSTVYVYDLNEGRNGVGIEDDITYITQDGNEIFLSKNSAGIFGISVALDSDGKIVEQPEAIIIDGGNQITLPIRYAFDSELRDFGSGIEVGIFIYPRIITSGGQQSIDLTGVALYLSGRTVKSQLARHYLYNEVDPTFNLVHVEDSFIITEIKKQNPGFENEFIHFGGLQGPIKIWEINYPEDIKFKEEYLETAYPPELRAI